MKSIRLILVALFALGPLLANAVPIVGEINMTGDVVPTGGSNLNTATGLSFPGNDFVVTGATGDFAAATILVDDIGIMNDFQFDPWTPNPATPLWEIGGFKFFLQSISIDYRNNFALNLSGAGVLRNLSYDETPGTWTLAANGTNTLFNFASGSSAPSTAVPEPTTLALLGIGLLGLGLTRRRKKI